MDNENELLGSEEIKDDTVAAETESPAAPVEADGNDSSGVRTIMTIGGEERSPMVMHTVSLVTDSPVEDKSNLVKVRIEYPKKWDKPKFFKDGDIREVAKETADRFVVNKMASIITEEKEAQ